MSTLCDPTGCSPPGSSVHGILQARILEWVAILFSRGSSPPRDRTQVSHIAGRFFTIWAMREALMRIIYLKSGLFWKIVQPGFWNKEDTEGRVKAAFRSCTKNVIWLRLAGLLFQDSETLAVFVTSVQQYSKPDWYTEWFRKNILTWLSSVFPKMWTTHPLLCLWLCLVAHLCLTLKP